MNIFKRFQGPTAVPTASLVDTIEQSGLDDQTEDRQQQQKGAMTRLTDKYRSLKNLFHRKESHTHTTFDEIELVALDANPPRLPLLTRLTHEDYHDLQQVPAIEPIQVIESTFADSDDTSHERPAKTSTPQSSLSPLSPSTGSQSPTSSHSSHQNSLLATAPLSDSAYLECLSPLLVHPSLPSPIVTPIFATTHIPPVPSLSNCTTNPSSSEEPAARLDILGTGSMSDEPDVQTLEQYGVGRGQKWKNKVKGLSTGPPRPSERGLGTTLIQPPVQDTVGVFEVNDEHASDAEERCDWKTIQAIPDSMFCRLLLNGIDPGRRLALDNVSITGRTNGSYHEVVMLRVHRDGRMEDYVLRIPAHGTSQLWTDQDEYMMQREVELMVHLNMNTKVPVPEIIDQATHIQAGVGFPYILMRKLPGDTAYQIWFDDIDNYDPQTACLQADSPTPETEKKRITFLRSLAAIMSELGQLHFDEIGVPIFHMGRKPKPPSVGPSYHWNDSENGQELVERPTFKTTKNFIDSMLDTTWNHAVGDDEDVSIGTGWRADNVHCMHRGIRKILDIVFALPSFNQENETFTICHPDLDLQNVLTDEEGNITGIIDWDGSFVAPRCIGSGALPKFLNRDWFPSEVGGLFSAPHLLKRMDHYRDLYAGAMAEFGSPDAHLTYDSAMYAAVMGAVLGVCGGGDVIDFTEKFLRSMPSPSLHRVDHVEFLVALGRGWPYAEAMLKQELSAFMQRGLPNPEQFQLLS
jgi:hypothetical protein